MFHSEWCGSHRCAFIYCGEKRLDGFRFCETHRCHQVGCNGNVVDLFHHYCIQHTCVDPGCTLIRFSSTLCTIHKCHKVGCDDIVVSDFLLYCLQHEHTCAFRGCMLLRQYPQSCATHKCIYSECDECAIEVDIGRGWPYPSRGCQLHTCRENRCWMVPALDPDVEYPTFCQTHIYRLGIWGSNDF